MSNSIKEIIDTMTPDQKTAAYTMIAAAFDRAEEESVQHSDDLKVCIASGLLPISHSDVEHIEYIEYDDELVHYGVKGMKWGVKRSDITKARIGLRGDRSIRLDNKANKLNNKAIKLDKKNSKKLYKLQKKEYKYDFIGDQERLREVQLKIKKTNLKSAKLRWKEATVRDKMRRNERATARLNSKLTRQLQSEYNLLGG